MGDSSLYWYQIVSAAFQLTSNILIFAGYANCQSFVMFLFSFFVYFHVLKYIILNSNRNHDLIIFGGVNGSSSNCHFDLQHFHLFFSINLCEESGNLICNKSLSNVLKVIAIIKISVHICCFYQALPLYINNLQC